MATISVSPPPPLIKLDFMPSSDTPLHIWKQCLEATECWEKDISSRFNAEIDEYNRKMAVSLVWRSNVLEGTIPQTLSEDEAITFLMRNYCEAESHRNNTTPFIQLLQHLHALKLFLVNKSNNLTEDLIKEAHKVMMNDIKNEQGTPVRNGAYREISVAAGAHIFPSYDCIPQAMSHIVEEYNKRVGVPHDPYELAAWLHLEVVSLHPFEDGNGRISRLLWCYSLMKDGLPFPAVLTSGHKKSQKHLVKCLQKDRNLFYARHPHMTTLTVVSVLLAWKEFFDCHSHLTNCSYHNVH